MVVVTLLEYGRVLIGISEASIIDKDAQKTKIFQLDLIKAVLKEALEANEKLKSGSDLLMEVSRNQELFNIFAHLLMAERSTVIKGRGLTDDPLKYQNSESPLNWLHRILTVNERSFVFDIYRRYHHVVFEQYELLELPRCCLLLLRDVCARRCGTSNDARKRSTLYSSTKRNYSMKTNVGYSPI